ncbi:MAG: ZinT/AdcA family metal-binding protein [Tissierellia bacterium]|nr:ZinT/AdcA family metal-binding protein [Tissierellia bacterium]
MKNFKKLIVVGTLASALLLTACGGGNGGNNAANNAGNNAANNEAVENNHNHNNEAAEDTGGEISMADWDGEWNNMGAYLDEEELQPAFEELAEKEGVDVAKAKADYVAKRQCDFDGLVIEGDKVTFLDGFKDKDGNSIGESEFEFVESKEVQHGASTLEWNIFKAKSDDAPYKVLLMMPVHGEEALTHFHMRYGDDADELLAKEGWYPTFVKPSSTMAQLTEEITE